VIVHWLNRQLEVWRPQTVPDGSGGQRVTYVRQAADVRAKVDQPSAAERILAQQAGVAVGHPVYLMADADVRRGDELRDAAGLRLRVVSVVGPSTARYLRADCEMNQREGEQ